MNAKMTALKNWYLKDDWWHFIIGFTVIYSLGLILELTGYWWTMIIAAAIGGVIVKHGGKAIIAGFCGIFLAWATHLLNLVTLAGPTVFLNFLNLLESIIGISGGFLVFISLLLGGLAGLVGAVNSAYISQIVIKLVVKEETTESKKEPTKKIEKTIN